MCVGIGYDIHVLKKGRKLILGGVEIPHSKGLFGHSDGDALFHALVDAALGAAGLGDIGEHFSDRDPRWKGASGELFARKTAQLLKQKRLRVAQIDSVLILEAPKLSAYKKAMRAKIAFAFGLAPERVNVKAKTNEGLGPIGRGEAIAATAVVLLEKA
jgi:2-C-methyl-D-erythritol 2,4-cyclodiphosphate synthase